MGTDIPTELSALKAAVEEAIAGPMMPTERVALQQLCHVVELIAIKLNQVSGDLSDFDPDA